MAILADELAKAIAKELTEYDQSVTDGLKEDIRSVSGECVKEIQARSPVLTGSYKKGWKDRVAFESKEELRMEIYNKTDAPLAHLLEYGHAGPGGVKQNAAAPYPHLRIAEQNAERALEGKVKAGFR